MENKTHLVFTREEEGSGMRNGVVESFEDRDLGLQTELDLHGIFGGPRNLSAMPQGTSFWVAVSMSSM